MKLMKKFVALLVVLSMCIVFCACGNGYSDIEQQQTVPTQKPAKYEDTLFEIIKIGDSRAVFEKKFGQPYWDNGEEFSYSSVRIFEQFFYPFAFIENDKITRYGYEFRPSTTALQEAVYKALVDNFIEIYGEPNKTSEDNCTWYFLDGRTLCVSKGFFVYSYVKAFYY